ncbi:MAG: 50S ribosomal protein L32 [Candidatus Saelkia tenebricola]|nr:50S ribosomal protein L32 [Candidatus Saelkia tenebricola]
MANPKRRHSNTRTKKRRTHWKASSNAMTVCPDCKSPKPMHRVCPKCGTYKGRQVLDKTEE